MKIDMTKRIFLALALLFPVIFCCGCSSHIDKQKFREIRVAAGSIDKALEDATLPYSQFEALLNKLTDEVAKTKAVVSTKEEKVLLSSFEELLTPYQEGAALWEYKIGSSQYNWIPKGRIYMDAKVRMLAQKYHFTTDSHVVELTNHHWESISSDSLKVIWGHAHGQLKKVKKPLFF